jgi:hypothetical protein
MGPHSAALARCDFYRRTCGLPAELALADPDRIVLPVGGDFGAIVMPEDTGRRVALGLRSKGPVIEHPRSHRWTFIYGLGRVASDIAEELSRLDISIVEHGQVVVLPSPADESARFRLWVQHPERRSLPPLFHLLAVTRGVIRHHAVATGDRSWA